VFLADFGMIHKNGATPVFCAPEQIDKPVIEKTDVHAFGITILFVFYTFNSAINLLFLSKKDVEKSDVDLINNCEIVKLMKEMTFFDAKKRLTLVEVKSRLKKIKEFSSRKNPTFATSNKNIMINTLKLRGVVHSHRFS
jgi:type I restriction-modification system DNA methylase subunit